MYRPGTPEDVLDRTGGYIHPARPRLRWQRQQWHWAGSPGSGFYLFDFAFIALDRWRCHWCLNNPQFHHTLFQLPQQPVDMGLAEAPNRPAQSALHPPPLQKPKAASETSSCGIMRHFAVRNRDAPVPAGALTHRAPAMGVDGKPLATRQVTDGKLWPMETC